MARRADSDEYYVIDLCEEVVGESALRQHRFDWLQGDPNEKGQTRALPVDGYWPRLGLVVEYQERQHGESVAIFDKRDVITVSGVHRGAQRRIYDARRATEIPQHGLTFVTVPAASLAQGRRNKLARDREHDLAVMRDLLPARDERTDADPGT